MPRSRSHQPVPEPTGPSPADAVGDDTPRSVLIELQYSPQLELAALTASASMYNDLGPALGMTTAPLPGLTAEVPPLMGLIVDPAFPPVEVPRDALPAQEVDVSAIDMTSGPNLRFEAIADSVPSSDLPTYVVRGQAAAAAIPQLEADAAAAGTPIRIFRDPPIQVCGVCPGDPPMGTDADVERLLDVAQMRKRGMDGSGVMVAIVDTGINLAHLKSRGKDPLLDVTRSWVPRPDLVPGELPVGHGTMCAYDVCIAAPRSTLLDIPVLLSRRPGGSAMEGYLSDALLAYSHLLTILRTPRRPGETRSLVINNSWGMFHPTWDFPVGSPGNYSDNPNHPFNVMVGTLDRYGADILFAAGNCGTDCPDGRCQGVTTNAIYGANSHPSVLSVAGVDITKQRVGYSCLGPGRLDPRKPDLSGYTHFRGSGVYAADGGTSAATPVVAGVVAALRSRFPYVPARPETSPQAIRSMLQKSAVDAGAFGYDPAYGWGIVNGSLLGTLPALRASAAD